MARCARNEVLAQLREITGETQAELAARIGYGPASVGQVEAGGHRLPARIGLRIWDVYRVELTRAGYTLEDLLRGSRDRTGSAETGDAR